MNKTIRNLSLLMNVVLVLLMGMAVGWIWKMKQPCDRLVEASKTCNRAKDAYEAYINTTFYASSYIGTKFPQCDMSDINNDPISTDFSRAKGGLVLIFGAKSCQPCLTTQLKALQHLYEALAQPAEMPIYAVASSSPSVAARYVGAFNLGYRFIADTAAVVEKAIQAEFTPMAFLVDANNTIIDCHHPVPGRNEISIMFYNEIRRKIANSLGVNLDMEKSSYGLTGTKAIDVIRADFDARNLRVFF